MTGFRDRMSGAEQREASLRTELESRGWTVDEWVPVPEEAHRRMIDLHLAHPLRWWPDLFAMKGSTAILVDAKGEIPPGRNAAIEANAAWTYESIGNVGTHGNGNPTWCTVLIFWHTPDGWVGCNADSIYEFTEHDPRPGSSGGSGTPWYLIPADWGGLYPLDRVLNELPDDRVE